MRSAIPSGDASPDTPVFGAAGFVGRTKLAQNLLSRCLRGQSILLYGGPKLGKTSVLLHLKWLVDQNRNASSATLTALYLDLAAEEARDQLLSRRWADPASILLLDNCDSLLNNDGVGRLHEFMKNKTLAQAILWAGARAWHAWVLEQKETADLQPAPLAVLLPGEAQELLKSDLAPDQVNAALVAGGTHPYVLKTIAHALQSLSGDPGKTIQTVADDLTPFFQACREDLRKPAEQALLHYLVKEARPVNPREAAKAVGHPTIKPSADVLCFLGLISRWNLNEGAVLQANCRLFNDWYLATGH